MIVSIITVTYNSATTLPATIASVLSQQGLELEYIIIDGASTDGTLEVIKQAAARDERIRWISEPDKGIADAFNKGLTLASNDWVGILNSDDLYTSGALATVAEFVKNNPGCDVIHGDMTRLDEKGKPLFLLKPANVESTIWRQMPLNHPTMFVSMEAYKDIGFFATDLKVAMDYELVLRLFLAGKKFCYLNKTLAKMSYGGASDEKFIGVRREFYQITVQHGYPAYKAVYWFMENVARGGAKVILRKLGLHALLRLHPRFRKGKFSSCE